MEVVRGLAPPLKAFKLYDFDALRHGDAIKVKSKLSAQEMFRRWRKARNRRARLVSSPAHPDLLFFIDEV